MPAGRCVRLRSSHSVCAFLTCRMVRALGRALNTPRVRSCAFILDDRASNITERVPEIGARDGVAESVAQVPRAPDDACGRTKHATETERMISVSVLARLLGASCHTAALRTNKIRKVMRNTEAAWPQPELAPGAHDLFFAERPQIPRRKEAE